MNKTILLLLAALLAIPASQPATAATPDPVLEKVIFLARHGIRSPTKSNNELSKYSEQVWPEWTVAPGELTKHGAQTATDMGFYLRRRYSAQGLLAPQGCPPESRLFVWADNSDQRTLASGQAFASGLAPGCGLSPHSAPTGTPDPLFGSDRRDRCSFDPEQAKAAILARAGGNLDKLNPAYEQSRIALQNVLFSAATETICPAGQDAKCLLMSGRNTLLSTDHSVKLDGPLAIGATISESLLLEYAEGFAPRNVGWGRATAKTLDAIMPLHDLYADLMRRTPYLASRHGALLAKQIVDLLEEAQPNFAEEAPVPGSAKVILFVGHDTNLSNIASLLGIDWTLPGQPDKTAPDTTLAFEIWRDRHSNDRFVRLVIHYQTLAQLRRLKGTHHQSRLAESITVAIPGCVDTPKGLCRLKALTDRLAKAIEPSCL
jgi:4-phytase/acid phosphatase